MARVIVAGRCSFFQPDFFEAGQRKTGVTWAELTLRAFSNGALLAWPLANGAGVPDSSVSSGAVYFDEVVGCAGFYRLRFFPDRVGYWRLVLQHPTAGECSLEFDSVPAQPSSSGLTAQFGP
jgi:hypothetical protein